jgi:hypothetical protein
MVPLSAMEQVIDFTEKAKIVNYIYSPKEARLVNGND